ncbi:hypothetical protein [Ancylomarina sp. 16SWW S1-10-2]|uniref:hypothetical protein n=1 Tax=Ancylomarina sp. 16SWW S1-10-2 TaxID=2499681 RepID=UPI0012ADCD6C|nr:hypothetical protein [Ancylomarina sp. 16SWW S1-10-2]MRT92254.1 hypothetical protein [Ancylomarina sp. 16SWW S1-10-2]
MNLGSTITGAILVAICVVPVVMMEHKRKKKERKTLQSLINIANQHNCKVSKHEICGDFVIGIDETKKHVFFSKQLADGVVNQSVNLADVKNCVVQNATRRIVNKDSTTNVVDKLELNFIPFDKSKSDITMEFFNSEINTQLNGELQSFESWSKLIKSYLK